MISNVLDKLIGIVSPKWYAQRTHWRYQAQAIQNHVATHESMRQMMGGTFSGGYQAGKTNRLTSHNQGSAHENDLPRHQIDTMRLRSWNLYRNNPQCRKINKSLAAKVVGRGLTPQPQVMLDNEPFVAFRKRARDIWREASKELDYRGKPGRGGEHLTQLHKMALRHALLSGGCLLRFHHLSPVEQRRKNLLIPLQVRLIHIDRIDETKHDSVEGNNKLFYGVELNSDGIAEAYWLKPGGAASDTTESRRVPASELVHLYLSDDIDQILGSPQFCATLLTADDRRHYEQSEMTAAEMGSMFVAGYRRSSGQSQLGLPNPDNVQDLTDADGNAITYLQPGLLLDLGETGEFDTINMNRPNSGAEAFINHLIRGEAVSMPGVKATTVTGDYRNASFSSERSADNDIWPEIEDIQDWIASSFTQPIYEEVINAAVLAGLFDDIQGFSQRDFNRNPRTYLSATWQGPVARSINPKDDVKASRDRVKGGISSVQREAQKVASDWREVVEDNAEFINYCMEQGLPEDFWRSALGLLPEADSEETDEEAQDRIAAANTSRVRSILGFQSTNHADTEAHEKATHKRTPQSTQKKH